MGCPPKFGSSKALVCLLLIDDVTRQHFAKSCVHNHNIALNAFP
jgi:hypothetical protein